MAASETKASGGMHPERIIPSGSFFYRPFSILYSAVSRIISFSDTLEVMAIK